MLSLSWDMYVSFPGAMLVEEMWGAFQYTIFSSGRSAWLGHFWLLLKCFWDSRPHSLWRLQSLHLMASLCGHQIASSKWPTTIFISTMGISLYIVAATKSESLSSLFLSLSLINTHSLSFSFQLKYPQWALTSKSVHVSEKFLWIHHLLLVLGWGGQGCVCVWVFPLSTMGRMSGLSLIPPQPTILNIVLAGSWTDGSG